MSETWIEWAIKAPTTYDPVFPTGKDGYFEGEVRELADINFIVNHDARGYLSYLIRGHRPGEQASWTFTNDTDGKLYQHKPLERIAWTSGNRPANTHGIGVEHANLVGPWGIPQPFPFTDAQAETDAKLFVALQRYCPNLGAPVFGDGVRIHKLVAPGTTTCPNGRDRYDYYDRLVTPISTPQEDDMIIYISPERSPNDFYVLVDGCRKVYSSYPAFKAVRGAVGQDGTLPGSDIEPAKYVHRILRNADFDAIPSG